MLYKLKVLPSFFESTLIGAQHFEVLKSNRKFKTGDYIEFKEWTRNKGFTGNTLFKQITTVLNRKTIIGQKALQPGYIILGVAPISIRKEQWN